MRTATSSLLGFAVGLAVGWVMGAVMQPVGDAQPADLDDPYLEPFGEVVTIASWDPMTSTYTH